MDTLALLDAIFLFLETPENPKHVGAVLVFDAPPSQSAGPGEDGDDGEAFLAELVARFRDIPAAAPFNRRVRFHALSMPTWETLDTVDLDYHVRHVVLPSPGGDAELLDYVARAHEPLLDRDMPLWEFHVIHGLTDGGFALYAKIHHACVDGMSGIARIQACLHHDADDRSLRAPWGPLHHDPESARPRRPRGEREGLLSQLTHAAEALGAHLRAGTELSAGAVERLGELAGLTHGRHYLPFSAPRTAINKPISRSRSIGTATLPVDRVRDLAHHYGATVNDLVLALVDHALHRYLEDHDVDTGDPLVAMVAMSLRSAEDKEANTQACLVYVPLGDEHDSMADRLRAIRASSAAAKADARRYSATALTDHSMLMIGMSELAGRLPRAEAMGPVGNVLVSNVPGSEDELFFHGTPLRGAYPMSALMPDCALNVTLLRHGNQLDFGLIASRDTIPDVAAVAAGIEAAFAELEQQTSA
jgi:diacylglycerol O-acyltransferase